MHTLLKTMCWKIRMDFLNFRLNNYRQRIKYMDQNNLILDKQHFCTNGNYFNRDAKFTILERIEKDTNKKPIVEK